MERSILGEVEPWKPSDIEDIVKICGCNVSCSFYCVDFSPIANRYLGIINEDANSNLCGKYLPYYAGASSLRSVRSFKKCLGASLNSSS